MARHRPDTFTLVAEDAARRLGALASDYADLLVLLERDSVLREVARHIRFAGDVEIGVVGHLEPDGTLVLRNLAGPLRTSALCDLVVPAGYGLGARVLDSRRPYWVVDYLGADSITHDSSVDASMQREGIATVVAAPVIRTDPGRTGVHCVLYAGLRQPLSPGDRLVESIEALARTTAVALRAGERAEAKTAVEVQTMRQAVAFDLHDTVGALLFRIGAEVRNLSVQTANSPDVAARLRQIEDQVSEAASTLRECLVGLRQAPAVRVLPTVLQADCEAFERRTGTRCRLVVLHEMPEAEPMRRDLLIRIVRESLLNIEKHAAAKTAVVTVSATTDRIMVAVADDGVGLLDRPKDEAVGSGLGLESLADAVARVGGTFELVPNDDRGVTVRATVPLVGT